MKSTKKISRIPLVAVVVALVVALLAGSALAFNVTYQKVSMPDPYGLMTIGLDEASDQRTVTISGYTTFGPYSPSSSRVILSSPSISVTSGNIFSDWTLSSFSASGSYTGGYFAISAGTTYDVLASVAFSASEYKSLLVTGGGTFSVKPYNLTGTAPAFTSAYPATAQFLVNGIPVGSSVACSNGQFTFPDLEIALTSDISSLGVRFTFDELSRQQISTGACDASLFLRCPFDDQINLSPVPVNAVDYVPYFERVISWLQLISGSVNPLNDTLLRIESLVGGMNDSDSSLGRLSNVFARDDDIQLRDDMDDTLKEATSIFYDDTSSPSTAISTDTVSQAGETLKGVSSMFDSGFEATDAFQEIADSKDDFMAWFSTDTSSWLDTVPSTYASEGDPYNQWMIENQYAEMAKRRGE